jgi:DNA-binding transcriptional regulator LsrR (DeoR family)
MDLALLGNRALQVAVRRNLVCFPSQAPIFGKQPRRDVQWRLAVLYFIRGWSTREIAHRYGLTRERCGQIITDWRIRAVNMGYIQDITPDDFDALSLMGVNGDGEREEYIEVRFALAK